MSQPVNGLQQIGPGNDFCRERNLAWPADIDRMNTTVRFLRL
jgi:hypothetical protein